MVVLDLIKYPFCLFRSLRSFRSFRSFRFVEYNKPSNHGWVLTSTEACTWKVQRFTILTLDYVREPHAHL